MPLAPLPGLDVVALLWSLGRLPVAGEGLASQGEAGWGGEELAPDCWSCPPGRRL